MIEPLLIEPYELTKNEHTIGKKVSELISKVNAMEAEKPVDNCDYIKCADKIIEYIHKRFPEMKLDSSMFTWVDVRNDINKIIAAHNT